MLSNARVCAASLLGVIGIDLLKADNVASGTLLGLRRRFWKVAVVRPSNRAIAWIMAKLQNSRRLIT
jgi:hypothetical protein